MFTLLAYDAAANFTASDGATGQPHCPLLPGLPCLYVRFMALRYGLVTIVARAVIRR
jgi:hypothetical protein